MCFWLIKSLFTYPVEWRISFRKIAFIDKHSGFAIFKRGTKKEDKRWVRKKSVLKNAECPTIALSLTGFEKLPLFYVFCVCPDFEGLFSVNVRFDEQNLFWQMSKKKQAHFILEVFTYKRPKLVSRMRKNFIGYCLFDV